MTDTDASLLPNSTHRLLSNQTYVSITRRSTISGKEGVIKHKGIVKSIRIDEGCIYVGVGGVEFCVYDTDDVYAETIVCAVDPEYRKTRNGYLCCNST